jgi:hypothetical protein
MIHPVESALPSRVARIQQGGDGEQHSGMTFYEAVFIPEFQAAYSPIPESK